jgi:hypothetical protein
LAAPSSDPNDPAQQPYLFAADRARRIGLGNSCEASQETATLLASGGFAGRESALVTDHDLGRMVSVVAMQTAGLDLVEDRDLQGARLAGRDLGLVDQVPYLKIGQRVQLGGDCVWAFQPGRQQITDPWRFGFGATNIAVMVGNIPKGYDTQRWIPNLTERNVRITQGVLGPHRREDADRVGERDRLGLGHPARLPSTGSLPRSGDVGLIHPLRYRGPPQRSM